MDQFRIEGGVPLRGEVGASGSKNSVLALMAASLLSDEPVVLANAPRVRDLDTMLKILDGLGVRGGWDIGGTLCIDGGEPSEIEAPYDLVRTMRASFMVLGPLLARCGHARVSLPGGCAIGARPVDQHLKGMAALGAKIELDGGYVEARVTRLRGARVGLRPAHRQRHPERADGRGARRGHHRDRERRQRAGGAGARSRCCARWARRSSRRAPTTWSSTASRAFRALRHFVSGDRIEAGDAARRGSDGSGRRREGDRHRPGAPRRRAREVPRGRARVEVGEDWARLRRPAGFRGLRIKTAPFPGFPTDMQAQIMAVADPGGRCLRDQREHLREPLHARAGAGAPGRGHRDRRQDRGRERALRGSRVRPVMATDLRASACLVLAGLAASGETRVRRVYHIDRGYERIEAKIAKLGGRIRREAE